MALGAFGLFQGLRDEFASESLRGDLTVSNNVFNEWWLWVIGALVLSVFFLLESAFRLDRQREEASSTPSEIAHAIREGFAGLGLAPQEGAFIGGDHVEGSSTSTSPLPLVAVTGIAIAPAVRFRVVAYFEKIGPAKRAWLGLRLNGHAMLADDVTGVTAYSSDDERGVAIWEVKAAPAAFGVAGTMEWTTSGTSGRLVLTEGRPPDPITNAEILAHVDNARGWIRVTDMEIYASKER